MAQHRAKARQLVPRLASTSTRGHRPDRRPPAGSRPGRRRTRTPRRPLRLYGSHTQGDVALSANAARPIVVQAPAGGGHRDGEEHGEEHGEEQRLRVRGDLQVGEARGCARDLLLADHVDRGPRVAVGDSAAHLPRVHERHSAARHGVASCFDDFPYVSRRTAVFGSTPLRRAICCSMRASAGLRPSGAPSSSLTASPPLMSRAAKRNRRRTRSARSSGASSHTAALAFSKAARASEYGAYMCMTCASFRTVRRQCRWSTACERACQAAWLSWYGCISLLSRLSVLRSWGRSCGPAGSMRFSQGSMRSRCRNISADGGPLLPGDGAGRVAGRIGGDHGAGHRGYSATRQPTGA
ncbi:hypothetical protein EEZ25_30955 [Micromonospora aurantiaca]|nr:hypothetical protein EEZ25_30955 [Micromonospora aurantiaca]